MAKGCYYYAVEKCNGGPWERASQPFRDTPEGANKRYQDIASEIPESYSVRLCGIKVLSQRNGVSQ